MNYYLSLLCDTCRHRSVETPGLPASCAAFPRGIPKVILQGLEDHRFPYPGDNNICYEEDYPDWLLRIRSL